MAATDPVHDNSRANPAARLAGAIFAVLLTGLATAGNAATIVIDKTTPGASWDGLIDGFPGLATFDGVADLGGNALAVALKSGVTEMRSVIELPLAPLAGVAPAAIATATVTFNIDDVLSTFGPGTDFDGTAAERIALLTYSGNGVAALNDFTAGSLLQVVQIGAGITDASLAQSGPLRFSVDVRARLQSLLSSGATHLGLVFATDDSPTGTSIDDLGLNAAGPPGVRGATLPFLTVVTMDATPTPSPAPTPSSGATATPLSGVTPTPGSTQTPTPGSTQTPTPGSTQTPTPDATPTPGGGSSTPSPAPGERTPTPSPTTTAGTPTPTPNPGTSATPIQPPSPSAATPTPSLAPTPSLTPTPSTGVTPDLLPTPAITISGRPRATPGTRPTAPVGAPPAQPAPDAAGDQLVFYFDARETATTFLNLVNQGEAPLTVRVLFYGAALEDPPFEREFELAAGATRILDTGLLRTEGLPAGVGIAFANAVDAAGTPIVTRALAGNFSIANLLTGSAWGAPAAARRAVRRQGTSSGAPALGTRIDGVATVLRAIGPSHLRLASFYDPALLEPAEQRGNQIVFLSFDDVFGARFAVRAATTRWTVTARTGEGQTLTAPSLETTGVRLSHLEDLLGPEVSGSSGSLDLRSEGTGASNRLVYFSETLGTFGTGHLLPSVP